MTYRAPERSQTDRISAYCTPPNRKLTIYFQPNQLTEVLELSKELLCENQTRRNELLRALQEAEVEGNMQQVWLQYLKMKIMRYGGSLLQT